MPNAELDGIFETIKGAIDEKAEGDEESKPVKKAGKKRKEKHDAKVEQVLPGEDGPKRKRHQRATTKGVNYCEEKEIEVMAEAQAV